MPVGIDGGAGGPVSRARPVRHSRGLRRGGPSRPRVDAGRVRRRSRIERVRGSDRRTPTAARYARGLGAARATEYGPPHTAPSSTHQLQRWPSRRTDSKPKGQLLTAYIGTQREWTSRKSKPATDGSERTDGPSGRPGLVRHQVALGTFPHRLLRERSHALAVVFGQSRRVRLFFLAHVHWKDSTRHNLQSDVRQTTSDFDRHEGGTTGRLSVFPREPLLGASGLGQPTAVSEATLDRCLPQTARAPTINGTADPVFRIAV